MNGLNDYLNGLNMEVSKGEYSGYKIHFSLNFVPAGSVLDATILASNAKCGNMNIGNTIRKGNEYTNRNLNFGTKGGPNGTTLTVGGVTSENRDIVMNSNTLYDTRMNRIHEIFHTLGFSHPKGSGGSQGIMTYPPSSPSKKDANELGNSTFLPMIKIK